MEQATFAVEAEVEETHWWFVGRRRLFAAEIARLGLPPKASILEIGTSTGTNLRMLRDIGFTNVCGLDPSADAIQYCAKKGLGSVRQGDACHLPFKDASFDLVLATDVIEHIEDDARAVREIERVLKPAGVALITVPAFQSLWGLQDEVAQHKRRYRKQEVLELVRRHDLRVERDYYFNYILFAPIWLTRQLLKIIKPKISSENEINNPLVNSALSLLFAVDTATAPWLKVPFGVSVLVIARKGL